VVGTVEGKEAELLRFDCFDNHPHHHHGPENKKIHIMPDHTVTGNPIRWTITQLRTKPPAMLARAGYEELVIHIDPSLVVQKLDEPEPRRARWPLGAAHGAP
jgi:hypothetical protein